jgi:hypothetical protein
MKWNCSNGYVMAHSSGKDTKVTYCRPKGSNDLKRIGRELSISVGNVTMRLNGKHLRSIKKVLAEVGEI